jgi:hypothetical protein
MRLKVSSLEGRCAYWGLPDLLVRTNTNQIKQGRDKPTESKEQRKILRSRLTPKKWECPSCSGECANSNNCPVVQPIAMPMYEMRGQSYDQGCGKYKN